jgi:hypothetical protein
VFLLFLGILLFLWLYLNKYADSTLHDAVDALYQGVLYFQNVGMFHDARVEDDFICGRKKSTVKTQTNARKKTSRLFRAGQKTIIFRI